MQQKEFKLDTLRKNNLEVLKFELQRVTAKLHQNIVTR